jgi:hypothetical protein
MSAYMRYTHTVLDAWAFHKRFAASLLGEGGGVLEGNGANSLAAEEEAANG